MVAILKKILVATLDFGKRKRVKTFNNVIFEFLNHINLYNHTIIDILGDLQVWYG